MPIIKEDVLKNSLARGKLYNCYLLCGNTKNAKLNVKDLIFKFLQSKGIVEEVTLNPQEKEVSTQFTELLTLPMFTDYRLISVFEPEKLTNTDLKHFIACLPELINIKQNILILFSSFNSNSSFIKQLIKSVNSEKIAIVQFFKPLKDNIHKEVEELLAKFNIEKKAYLMELLQSRCHNDIDLIRAEIEKISVIADSLNESLASELITSYISTKAYNVVDSIFLNKFSLAISDYHNLSTEEKHIILPILTKNLKILIELKLTQKYMKELKTKLFNEFLKIGRLYKSSIPATSFEKIKTKKLSIQKLTAFLKQIKELLEQHKIFNLSYLSISNPDKLGNLVGLAANIRYKDLLRLSSLLIEAEYNLKNRGLPLDYVIYNLIIKTASFNSTSNS